MSCDNILLFFPHNFYEFSDGCHRRVFEILRYFRKRGFSVDLLCLNGYTNCWNEEDLQRKDLCNSIESFEWKPSLLERSRFIHEDKTGRLPDLVTADLQRLFKEIVSQKEYDFVVVSYVFWASLVKEVHPGVKTVIDIHDFVTLNQFLRNGGKGKFSFGQMFEGEIRAISRFDYALSISEEEKLCLQLFCPGTSFVNVPVAFEQKFSNKNRYNYDILFIGSDNPFNIEGMAWFMREVYPLLPETIRVLIIGKVGEKLEKRHNIKLIQSVKNLDDLYEKSRIAFCPLKGGTGLKVKVVEALSYSKPVVTTSWGLSGILQKDENGCLIADSKEAFAEAVKLLVYNEEVYRKFKQKAEDFFIQNFSKDICYNNLDKVFIAEAGEFNSPAFDVQNIDSEL